MGNRIREIRKSMGLSMKELAKKVGVSTITIHRIEKGEVSPSVAVLSEIAHQLNYPITSFFPDKNDLKIVRADKQPIAESPSLELRLLVPKGIIREDISISLGKAKLGECISMHTNSGAEITYIIKGNCIFVYDGKNYELNEGDIIFFRSTRPHAVITNQPMEFFSVYVRNGI
ncbi:MAG TPA: helix-turn-helix domain-containing protein [Bacteroidales bacterium]|nr:helix-turn-helix domain-containing protein [Bacteroidales bacterium]